MIVRVITALLAVLIFCGTAFGMQEGVGVGLIIGEPTGFVVKKWLNGEAAIDGAIAWSFDGEDSLHLHGDYLLHNDTLIKDQQNQPRKTIPVYYGLGARVKFEDDKKGEDLQVGIRVPLGINFLLREHPIDFFAEIVPVMDFAPDTELDLNAAIGVRYFFK